MKPINSLWRGRRRRRIQLAHEREPLGRTTRGLIRLLMAALLLAAAILLFPLGISFELPSYLEGMIASEEVIADFAFDVDKPEDLLEREQARAAEGVRSVFTRIQSKPSYDGIMATLRAARGDSARFAAVLDSAGVNLGPSSFDLVSSSDIGEIVLFETERVLGEVNDAGLVESQDADLLETNVQVGLRTERGDEVVSTLDLYEPSRLLALAAERGMDKLGPAGSAAMRELAEGLATPNLRFDPQVTEANRRAARNAVSPIMASIQKDERIIDANERITREDLMVLEAYQRAQMSRNPSDRLAGWLWPILGRALLMGVILTLVGVFLRQARPDVWGDLGLLALMSLVTLLTLILAAVVFRSGALHPFVVPISLAAILITMLIGAVPAVVVVIGLSALLGTITGWGLPVTLSGAVGGVIAAFSVRNAFHRLEFLRAALPITGGMVATVVGVHLVGPVVPLSMILRELIWVAVNVVFSIAVAMTLLPILEKMFGLASNLTLLELSDLNRPIFKRMVIEANGTYHHSMVVGLLSEAAAEAIEANPLLSRVGAYYHDIGKIAKSGYFGENLRMGAKNPHERLTPTMSSLILESHVREGLEMAREIGLPKSVAAFIPEHQGTTLMQYFYAKALEMDPEVEERDYRYPGPRPQTRETGIVMLADAAEATVRSLDDQSPSKIRAVLMRLFEARIADGQLDDCGLTVSELAKARDAFTHVLTGVHHSRVKYQWQKDGGERALGGEAEERVFRPELETGISTVETTREFTRPSSSAGGSSGS